MKVADTVHPRGNLENCRVKKNILKDHSVHFYITKTNKGFNVFLYSNAYFCAVTCMNYTCLNTEKQNREQVLQYIVWGVILSFHYELHVPFW